MKLWKRFTDFFSGYYSVLLIFLFLIFILRPYDRSILYLALWKGCLSLVFFSSVFNCKHSRKIKILVFTLGIPALILPWINFAAAGDAILVINAVFTVLFITCAAGSILYDVILRARVTMETLRGVICAYFMIAFAFAYMYYLVEFIVPGTIHFTGRVISIHNFPHFLSEMFYFSFVTLLTIGYGDITAALNVGQTIAVVEGIIGQFYIAILVARLVSVYSFYSDKKLLKTIEQDIKKKHE
jgi:voltage-gated potassium channel